LSTISQTSVCLLFMTNTYSCTKLLIILFFVCKSYYCVCLSKKLDISKKPTYKNNLQLVEGGQYFGKSTSHKSQIMSKMNIPINEA
jgi:hypothetical protein